MKRLAAIVLVSAVLVGGAQASAHVTTEFTACTVQVPGMCIRRGAAFIYGDTVIVKGRVKPVHAGSRAWVLRREPCLDPSGGVCREGADPGPWERVASVRVNEHGRMRFSWTTRYSDAVQNAPYYFKFSIPDHGSSKRTEAFVLFGE